MLHIIVLIHIILALFRLVVIIFICKQCPALLLVSHFIVCRSTIGWKCWIAYLMNLVVYVLCTFLFVYVLDGCRRWSRRWRRGSLDVNSCMTLVKSWLQASIKPVLRSGLTSPVSRTNGSGFWISLPSAVLGLTTLTSRIRSVHTLALHFILTDC